MQPLIEIKPTPAQAVTHQSAEGEQPPITQATPVAQRNEQTKEERARALLQGEPPKDAAPDTSEEASIDAQFDPETDELWEIPESGDPAVAGKVQETETEAETHGESRDGGPAEAKPETEEEEEEEDTKGEESRDGGSRRIRIKRDALSDRDFAILTLAKDKRITFAEAEQQLFGKAAAKEEPARSSETTQNYPTAQQISERIDALRAERDAAGAAWDAKKAYALNDELMELRGLLTEVRRAEAIRAQSAQQTAAQKYAVVETAAITRAVELYPDANTKGSRLNEKMQAKAASLHREDPAFFQNPKWPILLAVETATELGIAAKVKETGKATGALPIPKKTTRPAPFPAPGTATSARTYTEAALREELKVAKANRDVEGIKAVMRKLTAAV